MKLKINSIGYPTSSLAPLFFICVVVCFFSCRGKKMADEGGVVVATSSWTAAYAEAAGAEKIVILAPFDMVHPSEYELRPGDIPKLMNAKLIVFAGYEIMTERLKEGLNLPAERLLQIETDYNFESMEKSILKIAVQLGTESVARENIQAIQKELLEGKMLVDEKRLTNFPVVVHWFQTSLALELGFVPDIVFGPDSPEASEIIAVSKTGAYLIIDNYHNAVGQPFKEVLPKAFYCQFLNFPGQQGTKTLSDVIRYNISQLTDGM